MAYRARKSFATGRTFVQEGKLYDTDYGLPDRFDKVEAPESAKEAVRSPRKAARGKAKAAPAPEPAPEDNEDA